MVTQYRITQILQVFALFRGNFFYIHFNMRKRKLKYK